MTETRRRFDQDFKDGAVRIIKETGKPIVRVAQERGVNAGTLANWVNMARQRRAAGMTAWARRAGRAGPAA
jgi:transposase